MNYRLLVIDIDGTLLGSEGGISDEDKEALAAARQAGVKVCLSTGRAVQGCRWIVDELSLDGYHVFFDGALVSGPDKELYVEPLGSGVVKEVVEFVRKNDIYLELYSATDYFVEWENWATEIHRNYFKLEPRVVDFSGLGGGETFIKGGLITRDAEEVAKAKSFRNRFDRSLRFSVARSPAYPGVEFINVLAPEVSKGKALTTLASHLGISLSEVMAIGDGTNDISLLSIAGLAVAMGNAPDEVKAVAHRVTDDVGRSGVAAAIKKFLL
ncbi:MAG TPA: Cof-type HAD-IIB family hydrolase [Dehalococcoidales bacterium]|nr:Cof-type HAD-IIB family hydrolase [Dehalococcoidales bacterium]